MQDNKTFICFKKYRYNWIHIQETVKPYLRKCENYILQAVKTLEKNFAFL